ncbi:hypothetical protein EUX98_g802 [Antrodiella citrinella]|uniref:Uncharacterized protein n=1 Tax=Antrodiella citrinella TaxID=2447956 RepID=A0A4S4N5W5_9APHY|nr:hypothetical protein EUX98_g802 [Antrodiella citrinella]
MGILRTTIDSLHRRPRTIMTIMRLLLHRRLLITTVHLLTHSTLIHLIHILRILRMHTCLLRLLTHNMPRIPHRIRHIHRIHLRGVLHHLQLMTLTLIHTTATLLLIILLITRRTGLHLLMLLHLHLNDMESTLGTRPIRRPRQQVTELTMSINHHSHSRRRPTADIMGIQRREVLAEVAKEHHHQPDTSTGLCQNGTPPPLEIRLLDHLDPTADMGPSPLHLHRPHLPTTTRVRRHPASFLSPLRKLNKVLMQGQGAYGAYPGPPAPPESQWAQTTSPPNAAAPSSSSSFPAHPPPGAWSSTPAAFESYGSNAPSQQGYATGAGRIQLAPIRPPRGDSPDRGSGSGISGKKNPLSIGNIISEDA